jgi:hypothetical protein
MGMSHEDSGRRMGVSRATFGRIIQQARQTLADAIINGKAVRVEGGNYELIEEERRFICNLCRNVWSEPYGTGRPEKCSVCGQNDFKRLT